MIVGSRPSGIFRPFHIGVAAGRNIFLVLLVSVAFSMINQRRHKRFVKGTRTLSAIVRCRSLFLCLSCLFCICWHLVTGYTLNTFWRLNSIVFVFFFNWFIFDLIRFDQFTSSIISSWLVLMWSQLIEV